jgi:hypothetical protein
VQLPQAYRSLARPSSPLDAKASAVCLILFDLKSFGVVTSFIDVDSSQHHPIRQLSKSKKSESEREGTWSAGDTRALSRDRQAGRLLVTPERR